MKNVLLATTALVFTAGFAAAEIEMGATAKLGYGNYGTGTVAGGDRDYIAETDVTFTLSGEASGIAYSASAGIDESGDVSVGVISMSTAGFTVEYGVDEFGGLTSTGADGEDDDEGDIKISYANGGITASYEVDNANDDYIANVGFTTDGLTLGLEVAENNNADGGDATNEMSVGYTMGDVSVAVAYDSSVSDTTAYGDEAETTLVVGYDLGGVALEFKANDQEEMEATAAFTF